MMSDEEKKRMKENLIETAEAARQICGYYDANFDSRKCWSCLWCYPDDHIESIYYMFGDEE